jgi:membrane-bound ClpP family serine protease
MELDEPVEIGLLVIALIIGCLSFLENVIKHKYYTSLILFIIGFGFLISGVYLGELETFIGLIILIISHYLNYKNIQKNDGCHPHGCQH